MNVYATPLNIRQALRDSFDTDDTSYDNVLLQMSESISRRIDQYTGRHFFPWSATRYFEGSGDCDQWIDDIVTVTTVSISGGSSNSDGWIADTDFAATDYLLHRSDQRNPLGSYNRLMMDENGAFSSFPDGIDTVWIAGEWAYHDDRIKAWTNSGDAVAAGGLTSDATTLTIADNDGADEYGITPRFHVGQILKMTDSDGSYDYSLLTALASDTSLTIVRDINGTTALAHTSGTTIETWAPAEAVKQAAIIMSTRIFKRSQSAFEDATANPELGQLFFVKGIDPEAQLILNKYKSMEVYG